MSRTALMVGLFLAIAAPASAQNCKKGIPCGNSCISASKTCRVGSGTARAAPLPSTAAPNVPASAGVKIPPGSVFVASTGSLAFYSVAASCTVWREMKPATLEWFKNDADAERAGYRRSTVSGC